MNSPEESLKNPSAAFPAEEVESVSKHTASTRPLPPLPSVTFDWVTVTLMEQQALFSEPPQTLAQLAAWEER